MANDTVFDLVTVGLLVMIAGISLVFASMVASARKEGGKVQGGGVVLIGPIPIIFGSDARWATVAAALAVVLVILSLLFYLG